MNLDFVRNDFRFNARTSAVIYNKDLSKVLLFNVEGRDFYMLPGGRIEELEESIDTIKREIKEEIGLDNIEYTFLALSEEFVADKGYNNHSINIIYKGIYNGDITNDEFNGLEGDWATFKWINIDKINDYKIHPKRVYEMVKNPNIIYHSIDTLIKDSTDK